MKKSTDSGIKTIRFFLLLACFCVLAACENTLLTELLEPLFPEECAYCAAEVFITPTCTEPGYAKRYCTKHNLHTGTNKYIQPKHEFDWSNAIVTATVTTDGEETAECRNCDEKGTRKAYATGTPGLIFEPLPGGKACSVYRGEATAANIIIPVWGKLEDGNYLPVTEIGDNGFVIFTDLTDIKISGNITRIGMFAFSGCDNLLNVDIYDGVRDIDSYAFSGCNKLTNVIIPNSVSKIGDNAFYNCNSLTNVTISNRVTSIEYATFQRCSSLTSIIIPGNLKSIGMIAFEGCGNLTSVTLGTISSENINILNEIHYNLGKAYIGAGTYKKELTSSEWTKE